MENFLNYSYSKDFDKEKSPRFKDIDYFIDYSIPQNIDMFKRFLKNENRTHLSTNHTSSIKDTEIMPEYTDIERQIKKKLNDMRSLFDIKNSIFKAMQSENSYTLCEFRKGFKKLFFGPKGIVTKKSSDLRRYYKSFEVKTELNEKIYAGSLDYYDFLCNVKSSFDERLNFSNKKRLEIGGNFSISHSSVEKLHGKFLEIEKKKQLQKSLDKNNSKNNNNRNNTRNNDFNKFNKKINLNIENNNDIKKTKLTKSFHSLFLNCKEIKKNDKNGNNNKIKLINNTDININKNNEDLTQSPEKDIFCENSSNQQSPIKGYSFKKNNELLNKDIKKKCSNKSKFQKSFMENEINDSKDINDNSKKICITNENFYPKTSKKLLFDLTKHESNKNNYKNLKNVSCPRTEIKFYKTEQFSNKTPECSPKKLPNIKPKKLEFIETTRNTSFKNSEKNEINEIKNKNGEVAMFSVTDHLFKNYKKNNKKNFSLHKIRLALRSKNNNSKLSKSLNNYKKQNKLKLCDNKREIKEKDRNENSNLLLKEEEKNNKNRRKYLLSDKNFLKNDIKKSDNKPLKIYHHYNPKAKNDEIIRELLENIIANKKKVKPEDDSENLRDKFRKNIRKINYLRHSIAIVKGKYNIK